MTAPTTMIGRPADGLARPTHTELPDLAAALDVIDLQLVAGSPEVVLPRDHAQLLAALLTDLLNPRGHAWRGTRAPEAHTQPQRRTS